MSGPEKSIDILHLLFAFKGSKDALGGNVAVSWVPIQAAPGKMLGSVGSQRALHRRNGKSVPPQRGPTLAS